MERLSPKKRAFVLALFVGVLAAIVFIFLPFLMHQILVEKSEAKSEPPAKFYAIQWLSGLTNFQVDAASLAALTTPNNGDMIEVVGFFRSASSDKIFGLPYAATFYEIREFSPNDTIDLVGRGRKDHHVLVIFKKSQLQPVDPNKIYSIKGVWNFPLNKKPYIEVVKVKENKP